MNLERIVLLGHSLGSFVSSAYALRHPSRIRHLILEDPWGFLEYDESSAERRSKYPLWTKTVLGLLGHVNVMSTFRAAGPYGESRSRSIFPPDAFCRGPLYILTYSNDNLQGRIC